MEAGDEEITPPTVYITINGAPVGAPLFYGRSQRTNKECVFTRTIKAMLSFWVDNKDTIGEHLFTFDKVKIYNLFADYPHNLTPEENTRRIRIFLHFT